MNAVDLLTQQHRRLEAGLESLMDAIKRGDDDESRRLLAKVGDDLTVHIESEEQVFYPAVHAKRTEDILLESLEEHLSLKRLLADLLALSPGETTFQPKAKVLEEQCEHHHEEEEENLFPKVRKLIDARELDALGQEMEALQKRLCAEGDPRERAAAETDHAAELR